MKKLSLLLTLLMVSVTILESCKKGENDPLLSLRTRKGRLTGEWHVKDYHYKDEWQGNGQTEMIDWTHSGIALSIMEDMQGSSKVIHGQLKTHIFQFDPDGTFREEFAYNLSYQEDPQSKVRTIDYSLTEIGTWQFLGPSKDQKNKECLALEVDKRDYMVTESQNGMTVIHTDESTVITGVNQLRKYNIDRLAGSELVLEAESSTKITFGSSFTEISIETINNTETMELER